MKYKVTVETSTLYSLNPKMCWRDPDCIWRTIGPWCWAVLDNTGLRHHQEGPQAGGGRERWGRGQTESVMNTDSSQLVAMLAVGLQTEGLTLCLRIDTI